MERLKISFKIFNNKHVYSKNLNFTELFEKNN